MTERNEMAGLLTLEKFCSDAEECPRYYSGALFAFCYTSIGNISAINETYGRGSGDKLTLEASRIPSRWSHMNLSANI